MSKKKGKKKKDDVNSKTSESSISPQQLQSQSATASTASKVTDAPTESDVEAGEETDQEQEDDDAGPDFLDMYLPQASVFIRGIPFNPCCCCGNSLRKLCIAISVFFFVSAGISAMDILQRPDPDECRLVLKNQCYERYPFEKDNATGPDEVQKYISFFNCYKEGRAWCSEFTQYYLISAISVGACAVLAGVLLLSSALLKWRMGSLASVLFMGIYVNVFAVLNFCKFFMAQYIPFSLHAMSPNLHWLYLIATSIEYSLGIYFGICGVALYLMFKFGSQYSSGTLNASPSTLQVPSSVKVVPAEEKKPSEK